MATVNYTIRLDELDKLAAEQVFNKLGLTLAAGLNVYLKAVARQQRIPFDLALNEKNMSESHNHNNDKTHVDKEQSFQALRGVLAGYDIDLDKEREERILSK
ncbi:MAG: type II toxin-antitoxin system RelB/DinJ family antitoxin [Gracilibacteraceae bacterium]|jgi:DNA-damage-inducible protein J|nr:type II toxin-antitoxin system RelB/DinJ family antitoxin [Gracilibacteraceae bacterium]